MTLKEIAMIVGMAVLVHFALEAVECAIWCAYNKLVEWRHAKRKGSRK